MSEYSFMLNGITGSLVMQDVLYHRSALISTVCFMLLIPYSYYIIVSSPSILRHVPYPSYLI